MKEEAKGTGLDWFQMVDESADTDNAAGSSGATTTAPGAAAASVGGIGASSAGGMPPLEEDGSLHFYWIDAYEDSLNAPGSVYIFGKVRTASGGYASCSVALKGLERNVYVLPRKRALVGGEESGAEVEFLQVYKEVQQLCKNNRITKFGCKRVERSYAFEDPTVPQHGSYLKLVYSHELPALPFDASGTYFSKCFGTQTSCLERLLLKRKVCAANPLTSLPSLSLIHI